MNALHRLVLAVGVMSLVAVVAGAPSLFAPEHGDEAGTGARGVRSGAARADSTHARPMTMRRLLVSVRREPAPSRPGATMRALRVRGVVPRTRAVGTVVSDDDCAQDAAGISHCVNRIRLANGGILSVRHPHRMAVVPCMTPGERVQVREV